MQSAADWLAGVRHDLVKYAVWPARDLLELGAEATAADREALRRGILELAAGGGSRVPAAELWRRLRAAAPGSVPRAALDAFEQAVERAESAVRAGAPEAEALAAVLALEAAFTLLARSAGSGR